MPQQYSRKTPRAQRYDYSSPGGYFITICTKDRVHYFGEIHDGKMIANGIGLICQQEIQDTATRRPHIRIDEYIVMPNHVHILMIIGDKPYPDFVGTHGNTIGTDAHRHIVGTYGNMSSYEITNDNQKDTLPRVPTDPQCIPKETLGSIIRNIKSRVSTYASKNDIVFARQGRYHDHIIRNEKEYKHIKYYIQTNPANRNTDSLA